MLPTADGARIERGVGPVVMLVCLATGFATLFDSAALVVATPAVASDLGAGQNHLQWILAGYSLTFGLALIPAGRVGDAWGRPAVLSVGLLLFSVASTVAATAQTPTAVVIARLVQGVGAGIANPQVIGLMQDHFRGSSRARALGGYQSMGAAGGLLAPIIAGAVMQATPEALGWRVVTVLNMPLGVAAALLSLLVLRPRLPRSRRAGRTALDLVGLGLITMLTLALLLPFVVEAAGWVPWTISLAVLTIGGLALMVWERRYAAGGRLPLITRELARAPGFGWGCLVATFTFGSHLGFTAVLMLFLQQSLAMSPLAAGAVTIPGAVSSLVCSNLAWRMLRRFGRPGVSVLIAGKTVVALAAGATIAVGPAGAVLPVLVVAQTLTGALGGLSGPPNQALTLQDAPSDQHGVAAGVLQVSQRISATVSITALVGVFAALSGEVGGGVEAGRHGMVAVFAATAALGLLATVCSWADSRRSTRAVPAQPEGAQTPTGATADLRTLTCSGATTGGGGGSGMTRRSSGTTSCANSVIDSR